MTDLLEATDTKYAWDLARAAQEIAEYRAEVARAITRGAMSLHMNLNGALSPAEHQACKEQPGGFRLAAAAVLMTAGCSELPGITGGDA